MPTFKLNIQLADGRRFTHAEQLRIEQSPHRSSRFQFTIPVHQEQYHLLNNIECYHDNVIVEITPADDNQEKLLLNGYVETARVSRSGQEAKLIFNGCEHSKKMEEAGQPRSWVNTPLDAIFEEILSPYRSWFEGIQFAFQNRTIGFTAQHEEENDWDFIRRLAARNGIPLLLNGRHLLLGRLNAEVQKSLSFGQLLNNFTYSTAIVPLNCIISGYHPQKNQTHREAFPREAPSVKSQHLQQLVQQSRKQYQRGREKWLNYVSSKDELKKLYTSWQAGQLGRIEELSGTAYCLLQPGMAIQIEAGCDGLQPGAYIIKTAQHHIMADHSGYTDFTAVSVHIAPYSLIPIATLPICREQKAIVKEVSFTAEGIPVASVVFGYDSRQALSPPLRILSNSTKWYTSLREGDEVSVRFDEWDPDAPAFIEGSLFNAERNAKGWQKNKLKDGLFDGEAIIGQDENGQVISEGSAIRLQARKKLQLLGGEKFEADADLMDFG